MYKKLANTLNTSVLDSYKEKEGSPSPKDWIQGVQDKPHVCAFVHVRTYVCMPIHVHTYRHTRTHVASDNNIQRSEVLKLNLLNQKIIFVLTSVVEKSSCHVTYQSDFQISVRWGSPSVEQVRLYIYIYCIWPITIVIGEDFKRRKLSY